MITRLILDYPVILLLIVITFILVILLWKLRNFRNLYADFPKFPVLSKIVMAVILGKIPPHMTFHGYVFQLLMKASKRFQKEGMFLLWGFLPHLCIFDEESVKIFSNEQEALDKAYKYDIVSDMFGSGLFTSKTQAWRKQRKLLNPVFHLRMLKSKLSIFNENADILVKKLEELKDRSSIHIIDYIMPCAFGSIFEFIFGVKMDNPEYKELGKQYTQLVTVISQMMVYRMSNPFLHYRFMMNFIPSGRKYLKQLNDFHSCAEKIVLAMKENIISNNLNGINVEHVTGDEMQTRKSLVEILLEQHFKDPSFTMEDVKSQVNTFIIGGYETVAITIMWCLFMLGHHPEVQDQAYNEVESIPEGCIQYEDLHRLNYLDCVLKETLRLYPALPISARRLGKDIQFGKYKIPKNTTIVFLTYELHRNQRTYPDPELFQPDRFRNGNTENLPFNFIPFSEGIRHCIGKRFAMMEMKVVLAHILRNFQITSLDRKEDVELCWELFLAPARPLRFKLTPRK